jgi:hypothetical protein
MGSHIEPQRDSSCRQAFPQLRVLLPFILSVPCPRFRCVVQADGSSKGSFQTRVIDLYEIPITLQMTSSRKNMRQVAPHRGNTGTDDGAAVDLKGNEGLLSA